MWCPQELLHEAHDVLQKVGILSPHIRSSHLAAGLREAHPLMLLGSEVNPADLPVELDLLLPMVGLLALVVCHHPGFSQMILEVLGLSALVVLMGFVVPAGSRRGTFASRGSTRNWPAARGSLQSRWCSDVKERSRVSIFTGCR